MPLNPSASRKVGSLCSHQTKAGRPCKAWAIPATDPPACIAHSRRSGNPGALTGPGLSSQPGRGLYGHAFSPREIADLAQSAADPSLADEIAASRIVVRRLLESLQESAGLTSQQRHAAMNLILTGAATIGKLLRYDDDLTRPPDQLEKFINQALDEVSRRRGIPL